MPEKACIGVDIGGTHLTAGLVGPDGKTVTLRRAAVNIGAGAEARREASGRGVRGAAGQGWRAGP